MEKVVPPDVLWEGEILYVRNCGLLNFFYDMILYFKKLRIPPMSCDSVW